MYDLMLENDPDEIKNRNVKVKIILNIFLIIFEKEINIL